MTVFTLLLTMPALASAVVVNITPNDNGFIAVAPPFTLAEEADVETEVGRRAIELCAGKNVRWGKFGSTAKIDHKSEEASKVEDYYREFSCVTPDPRVHSAAPDDWKATPADEEAARAAFHLYYSRRDSGDFLGAAAMFDPAQGLTLSAAEQRAFNKRLGSGRREVIRTTWYVNPDGAAHPGVFVALDFIGRYRSMHFYCGYLVLYRLGPGSYEIVREEQNSYQRTEPEPDPAEVTAMRSSLCREG